MPDTAIYLSLEVADLFISVLRAIRKMTTNLKKTLLLSRLLCLSTAFIAFPAFPIDLELEPLQPLPTSVTVNSPKAALGKKLFFDKRLSKDNSISCASCHNLETAGVDKKRFSPGVGGTLGGRNSPTVFNASFNFRQFWDGRAADLVEQAGGPIVNPVEMASEWPNVIAALSKDPQYPALFEAVYGKGGKIDELTVTGAIAEFEKTLITANSPFDRYLLGDEAALSDKQKHGYELFKTYGCSSCHQGQNVGGNMFQKFGVLKDINLKKGNTDDLGRFNITGNEWEKHVFKVPSLRLAVLTPPYFHDGSVETIQEAVNTMIEFQLGRSVPAEDKDDIIEFLHSLVGEYRETSK
jgi:cytochrome c peroxidase